MVTREIHDLMADCATFLLARDNEAKAEGLQCCLVYLVASNLRSLLRTTTTIYSGSDV